MYQNPISIASAIKLPLPQNAWLLHRFDNQEVIRLHLAPGASMENHIDEWRIVFYVLRGSGLLDVEGKRFEMEEQDSIVVKAGKERFWKNHGTKTLERLVYKTKDPE